MRKPIANLGLFFSFAFLAGFVLQVVTRSFRGFSFVSSLMHPTNITQIAASILFYLSTRTPRLYWIQPAIFLAITPLPFIASHDNFYGIAFFVLAVLLLFKMGFFNSRRIAKVLSLLFYLYLVQLVIAIIIGRRLDLAITAVFFVTIFLVILYILYHDEIVIYLKEPRPVLDLKGKKLSEAEYHYLIELRNGKNLKQIAFEHGVSESTVRNTLARVYKKLAVKDKSELMALTSVYSLKYGKMMH